jgi:diguanylate cyclase (GGDEF)-like protein
MFEYRLYKPSRILYIILLVIIIFFAFNGLYIYLIYNDTKNVGTIVDLFSQIRIQIQKIEESELKNLNSDSIIKQVNGILAELESTLNNISPLNQDRHIQSVYDDMHNSWKQLIVLIKEKRNKPSAAYLAQIAHAIEQCEVIIDSLFAQTESAMSREERTLLRVMVIFISINLVLVILIGLIVKRYIREKLEHMATYDQLTLLLNRYAYNDIIEKEIAQANRNKSSLSLILFDIDHFKNINDTYGHDTGDIILKNLAQHVNSCIRKSDFLFRIGGEEFAIVAVNTSRHQASILAEKIRASVAAHTFINGLTLTLSLGVTELQKGDNVEALFKKADTVLYKAKTSGRDRAETYI